MERQTYIACLTPPGRGAIATLGLRGPRAWPVLRELFRPISGPKTGSGLPDEPEVGRFLLGRLIDAGSGASDHVVLAVRKAGPSPWLELHCHGGSEVVRLLLEILGGQGLVVCSWQELETLTAASPLAREARIALAKALTVRTAAIVLDQCQGTLSGALDNIRSAFRQGQREAGVRLLEELARQIPLGRHLTQPWRVVIAGAVNAGKSSLINALAGFSRSVVDPSPGTTRDVVTTLTAIDGWPVELADTAGWRAGAGAIEQEGMVRARAAMAEADLCLWLLDGSAAQPVFPHETGDRLRPVINKIDLAPAWTWSEAADALRVSAHTGAGLPELCQAISQWLVPSPPAAGAAVPFTQALGEQIERIRSHCDAGKLDAAVREIDELISLQ